MRIYPPPDSLRIGTTDGHVDDFGKLFNGLRSRWVKVERLQEYNESDFEGYRAFKRGNFAEAKRLVQEMVKSQDDVYALVEKRNIAMIRIRIYEFPLSSYLVNYEIPAYLADIECGEDIRFVDVRSIDDILSETGISDYVLFDDNHVVALIYDGETGSLQEARLVEQDSLVQQYVEVSDELIKRSTPMLESAVFQALNREAE